VPESGVQLPEFQSLPLEQGHQTVLLWEVSSSQTDFLKVPERQTDLLLRVPEPESQTVHLLRMREWTFQRNYRAVPGQVSKLQKAHQSVQQRGQRSRIDHREVQGTRLGCLCRTSFLKQVWEQESIRSLCWGQKMECQTKKGQQEQLLSQLLLSQLVMVQPEYRRT
jgi:hypothetical protein